MRLETFRAAPGNDDDVPDAYAHIARLGWWRGVAWRVSRGAYGPSVASGRTWTRAGATVEAINAAFGAKVLRRQR